eukprot:gene14197-14340_t
MAARDLYGFAVEAQAEDAHALQHAFAAVSVSAVTAAKKTANTWRAVDLQLRQLSRELPPPARLASLKPVVRKGIPYEMRPELWFLMSGAAARQQEAAVNGQTYASLSDINSLSKNTLLTVSEDLSPGVFLFRSHPLFKKQDGMDAVRRIIMAYLQRNPAGYFRGISHVAGFLLVVMGLPCEEEAFWTLTVLLEDKCFPYCAGQGSYGTKVELRVLELLVAKKLPKVAAHLAKLETSCTAITCGWFAGLFTTVLPSEVVARIFDSLLLEGNKVLLRMGLALLKTFERSICAASHPAQLRKVLDARLARMHDADTLMAAAFKG